MKKSVVSSVLLGSLITALPSQAQHPGRVAASLTKAGGNALKKQVQRITTNQLRILRENALKDYFAAVPTQIPAIQTAAFQDLLNIIHQHNFDISLAQQAARDGRTDLVNYFIQSNTDPSPILPDALAHADIVKMLLDNGAQIQGDRLFLEAAQNGQRETVELLCERLNPSKDLTYQMFSRAVRFNHLAVAQDLLDKWGVNLNYRLRIGFAGSESRPLLDECLSHNQEKQVHFLLQNGADPYAIVFGNQTLVHVTAKFYDPKYLAIFKSYGVDLNVRTADNGNTPLHEEIRSLERTKALIAAGADPTLRNTYGQTPLDEANAWLAKEKEDPKHANYALIQDLQAVINYYEELFAK